MPENSRFAGLKMARIVERIERRPAMSHEASKNAYDLVVVGGGIGGLTAGAFLAQAGKQVLVVEQEEHPGGFAREFQRGSYRINPSLHVVMGCGQAGPPGHGLIDLALGQLGVRDRCEFVAVDPFYRVKLPDLQLDVPAGPDAYLEVHQHAFPEEAKGFADLVQLCAQIYQEFLRFPMVPRLRDWALMPLRFPKHFRNANATLGSVMKRYLSNPRARAAYAALWPYLALPPMRVNFLQWATMMHCYTEESAFYCQGGFQGLADALAGGMVDHGGELVLGTRVTKIHAASSRVQGVSLENGQEIGAPIVISNIDARTTFRDLLEPDQVPSGYMRRLGRMEPSLSVLGLHLATDLDVRSLGVPKVTMIGPSDPDSVYADALRGRVSGLGMHIPTVWDETLAPPGEHLVVLQAFVPSDASPLSPTAASRFAEELLELAETVLPGLRDHLTFVEGRSEDDQERYPLHRVGPMYGWAASPQQAGSRRLPHRTPVDGLFLAGHWTQPGHGIWTVVLSGIHVARLVLGGDAAQRLWPFDL
jgi:prolycopene isomerase